MTQTEMPRESHAGVELNVVAEPARAVKCPECRTKYLLARHRDRLKCFTCEAILVVGIDKGDYQ